jgi:hypothetical protein
MRRMLGHLDIKFYNIQIYMPDIFVMRTLVRLYAMTTRMQKRRNRRL